MIELFKIILSFINDLSIKLISHKFLLFILLFSLYILIHMLLYLLWIVIWVLLFYLF